MFNSVKLYKIVVSTTSPTRPAKDFAVLPGKIAVLLEEIMVLLKIWESCRLGSRPVGRGTVLPQVSAE